MNNKLAIEQLLQAMGPLKTTEIAHLTGLDKKVVTSTISLSRFKKQKIFRVSHWDFDEVDEGEKTNTPRAVWAVGSSPDAEKPMSSRKSPESFYSDGLPKVRSIFDLPSAYNLL